MLAPNFEPCEGFDYGNKPIDLPFKTRNVIEFHLPFLLVSFCSKKYISLFNYICNLLVNSVLVKIVFFSQKRFISFGYFDQNMDRFISVVQCG